MCNSRATSFVKVYMDVPDPDLERIEQLEATAVSNAQIFISKLSERDVEIRELNAKLVETETVLEDLRSDLQYLIDEVSSHKQAIFRLERQLQEKDAEIEKTCSSEARAIRQMGARDKAKLKQKDDVWKMENELLHAVFFVLRFLFSIFEVLLLFLLIFDYGGEEQARRTVVHMLTSVVLVHGLVLDSNPALKAPLRAFWAVIVICNFVATNCII